MSLSDPIADFLTRIRNALKERKEKTMIPYSRLKLEMARILTEEGFLKNYKVVEVKGRPWWIRVSLKVSEGKSPMIRKLQRISRPGLRVYRGWKDLRPVRGGTGVALVTTSKGLLSDRQAREQRIGGEVLCEIY